MASMETEGLDELIESMKRMDELTGKMADEMADAGAEVIKKTWKKVIKQRGHIKTGAMLKSVGIRKPKAGQEEKTREIYPIGKDKKGVRNAEKAFMLHYGWDKSNVKKRKKQSGRTGKKKGDHFVDQIEEDAAEPVVEAMTRVRDQYIKGGR